MDWLTALSDLRSRGEPCVLVTVVEARGSVPREPGAKLVVTGTAQHGTIGGGSLEFQATATARTLLQEGARDPLLREIPLGPALGQCCGGTATLLFEPLRGPDRMLYLFGAGHVGRELVHVLGGLPGLAIRWIDARADQFPEALPAGTQRIVTDTPDAEILDAPPGSAFLVMTHSHDLDLSLVEAVLKRGDFRYLGLIGSATKRARFEKRLHARGIDTGRLVCPIGVPGIGDKHPRAIAIAAAAQLLAG